MHNRPHFPGFPELMQRAAAVFAEASKTIAQSHEIMQDAMAMQSEMRLAREQYDEMLRSGKGKFCVRDLPQIKRWGEDRSERDAAYLLALGRLKRKTLGL